MKTSIHHANVSPFIKWALTGLLLLLWLSGLPAGAQSPVNTDQSLQLTAGDEGFEALLKPANTTEPRGVVILLHGEDQHLNYPAVISTLRSKMTDYGWHTLSLQMPSPVQKNGQNDYSAYLDQALLRIQAALDYLDENHEVDRVYIIGHGLGGAAGLAFLTQEGGVSPLIKAFAGISLGHFQAETSDPRLNVTRGIEKLTLPMLDIYAQGDRMEATYYAKARQDAARRNEKIDYRQLKLPARSHQFFNFEMLLSKRIYGWMVSVERLLDEAEKNKPKKTSPPEEKPGMPMLMPEDEAPATTPPEMPPMPEEEMGEPGAETDQAPENGDQPSEESTTPETPPTDEGNKELRENLF